MLDNDTNRLSRLTAIITQLQTKRLLTAPELSKKFGVSVRTIYRDIRALEQAGVPICTEEGKGYSLMEGYRIPPVMFTENEANALITTEQLVLKNKDGSLSEAYSSAILKIKAVLRQGTKEKADILSQKILVRPQVVVENTSHNLTAIQNALTSYKVIAMTYHSDHKNETTTREIEPFAFYHNTQENWNLIAFCRLRKDFRLFRLDKIQKMRVLDDTFEPHKMTLAEYVDTQRKKYQDKLNTPDIPLS